MRAARRVRACRMAHEPLFRISILTEAGPARGLGHLARCSALGDALVDLGAAPEILVRGEQGPAGRESSVTRVTEWASPEAVSELLSHADAAVVDSYDASLETCTSVVQATRATVFFDDTVRLVYPGGIVVNGSPAAPLLPYTRISGTQFLLGLDYQSLRRPFWAMPARMPTRPQLSRVLVVFGGTDASGLREPTVAALEEAFPDVEFDVVRHPRTAEDMRDAMLAADAAVTAAGQTLYELARTGTPAVAACVADNQRPQALAWERAGAIILVDGAQAGAPTSLADGLALLANATLRSHMSGVGPRLLDGRGANRVARALLSSVLDERVRLRPATCDDEAALRELANDSVIRSSSFSSQPISEEAHHAWFSQRLADTESTLLLLAWDGPTLAGQVRFDILEDGASVSIGLAKAYRGLGWGRLLLDRAISRLGQLRSDVRMLDAKVKPGNLASISLFEAAGFDRIPSSFVDRAATGFEALEYRRAMDRS